MTLKSFVLLRFRNGVMSHRPLNYRLAKRLVFRKVRKALGLDRCTLCFTGAAPITKDTLEFFFSLDIPLYELYGMSESTGPHSMSKAEALRLTRYTHTHTHSQSIVHLKHFMSRSRYKLPNIIIII